MTCALPIDGKQKTAYERSEEHTSELQSHDNLVCRLLIRSEEHTSELQSHDNLVCRLLLEKKKKPPLQPPRSPPTTPRPSPPPPPRRGRDTRPRRSALGPRWQSRSAGRACFFVSRAGAPANPLLPPPGPPAT